MALTGNAGLRYVNSTQSSNGFDAVVVDGKVEPSTYEEHTYQTFYQV